MGDFDGLQSRVAVTAERLAVAQAKRRQRNQSLIETLAGLEEKFAAQQQEIAYHRERVRPLETANEQLRALMTRLLDMVDAGFDCATDRDDPVRIATEMAAAMLHGNRESAGPAEEGQISVGHFDDVDAETLAAEAQATMYDDADFAALAAEAANDSAMEGLPEFVRLACTAARDDEIATEIAAGRDQGIDGDGFDGADADEPDADIRALLQRVEAAAARVASAAEAAPMAAAAPAPAPARRVAGAA